MLLSSLWTARHQSIFIVKGGTETGEDCGIAGFAEGGVEVDVGLDFAAVAIMEKKGLVRSKESEIREKERKA